MFKIKLATLTILALIVAGSGTPPELSAAQSGVKKQWALTGRYLESFYERTGTELSDEQIAETIRHLAKNSEFGLKVKLIYDSGQEGKDIIVGLLKRYEVVEAARQGDIQDHVSTRCDHYESYRAVTQRIIRRYGLEFSPYDERNFTDASCCESAGCNYEIIALHRIIDGVEEPVLDKMLIDILRAHGRSRERWGPYISVPDVSMPFYYVLKMILDYSSEEAVLDFLTKMHGKDEKDGELFIESLQCLEPLFGGRQPEKESMSE